jgi:hypothetical protein
MIVVVVEIISSPIEPSVPLLGICAFGCNFLIKTVFWNCFC